MMKSNKSKSTKPGRSHDQQVQRRTRMLQIVFAVFSILLILSMILSAVATF